MFVTGSFDDLKDKEPNKVRFVCMSDTHGKYDFNFPIPSGDVFIHAGDLTRASSLNDFKNTIEWIMDLPHKIKIITAGNHDHILDERFGHLKEKQYLLALMESAGITYLEHESFTLPAEFGGFKMFVSPYAPIHLGGAFMPKNLAPYWDAIPKDIDILVTHTPPYGYQDQIRRGGRSVGCPVLRAKVDIIKPRVCVFGHIHEARGYTFSEDNETLFVNAATCTSRYRANQCPIVFDL